MKKKAKMNRRPRGERSGRRSGRVSMRSYAGSLRVTQSHMAPSATVTAEKTSSGARQPPSPCASGTASAEETVAPIEIAVA